MDNSIIILYNVVSTTKWIGVALIVLTWIQIIPLKLGWIGFGIALASYIAEIICKRKFMPPETEGGQDEQSNT